MPSTTPRVWPPHGDAYLREHHQTSTQAQMAAALGCGNTTISRRMTLLGLSQSARMSKRWPPERDERLLVLYATHTHAEIAHIFGCGVTTIERNVKRLGAKRPRLVKPKEPAPEQQMRPIRGSIIVRAVSSWGSYSPERICTGNMRGTYSGAELRTVPARFAGARA